MKDGKNQRLLEETLKRIGLEVNPKQERQLLQYVQLIIENLKGQRLVGTGDEKELICKHICDSLYPLKLKVGISGETLDLGTGAGFPGIPLKIYLPELPLFLMDSNRRKINFLKRVSAGLAIERVFYLNGPAEEWAREERYRERFETVVSRAVANTAALVEMALPLTKIGGMILLYKGPRGMEEATTAEETLLQCGGRIEKIFRYRLPTGEARSLLCLSKTNKTPDVFPRRPGVPAQKPLSRKKFYS